MVHTFSIALAQAPRTGVPQATTLRQRTNRQPVPKPTLILSLHSGGVCFGVLVHSRAMWKLVAQRASEFIPGILVNAPGRIQWLYSIEEPDPNGRVFRVRSGRRSLAIVRNRPKALEAMCSDLQRRILDLVPDFTAPDAAAATHVSQAPL